MLQPGTEALNSYTRTQHPEPCNPKTLNSSTKPESKHPKPYNLNALSFLCLKDFTGLGFRVPGFFLESVFTAGFGSQVLSAELQFELQRQCWGEFYGLLEWGSPKP